MGTLGDPRFIRLSCRSMRRFVGYREGNLGSFARPGLNIQLPHEMRAGVHESSRGQMIEYCLNHVT